MVFVWSFLIYSVILFVVSYILVEYGPVMIGANSYICPVRAVAMSKVPIMNDLGSLAGTKTELNDVLFTQYHVFRAESRIVPVEESEEP